MAKLTKQKIWGQFDEFGLINGLGHWSDDGKSLEYVRYPGETNKRLRQRTKESMKYRGNSTVQGMVNNISRDLGVGVSGVNLLPRYEAVSKTIFYLSEKPYPGPSGVRVFVSSSGSWTNDDEITPQVRASGFDDAVSGWIVWNQPDIIPDNIPNGLPGSSGWYENQGISGLYSSQVRYGEYTQILEFVSGSIPDNNSRVKVEYDVQTGTNTYGEVVINNRSDFSHPGDLTDDRFVGVKTEIPQASGSYNSWISGHVAIYSAEEIISSPISGWYYETTGKGKDRLIQLKKIIDEQYPLNWGKFRYDFARWDQIELASIGNIPSFHDSSLPDSASVQMYNGSRYGCDLDIVGVHLSASGTRSAWYPKLEPGELYIGNKKYYLFAKLTSEALTMTHLGNSIYSGQIASTGDDMPAEFDVISAQSSGVYFGDQGWVGGAAANNPYIKRLHDFALPSAGTYYRTSYVDRGSGILPADLDYLDGYGFYYDYDTGNVFASGVSPTNFMLFWEHRDVGVSGIYVTFSGGYGFDAPNLNPLSSPESRLYYFTDV